IASRRQESLDTAMRYVGEGTRYTLAVRDVVERSDVVGVTVQDREIPAVAREIATHFQDLKGKVFFHTSGAHTAAELKPLDDRGANLGSLHPLQTFPDVESGIAAIPSTFIFIEGDEVAVANLEKIASHLGSEVVRIESSNKVLYHLSAVLVCNLLCALLYEGEQIMNNIGIDLDPFYPIIRTTLGNIEAKGPLASLTGPVVRGDSGTTAAHMAAMKDMPQAAGVYRELSRVALEMAKKRGALSAEQAEVLERVLGG
ncbi:MAG TPA: hypothetical protein DCR97_13680, partial [Deltaproteobacteria bacterium]|nr:hypothetical protein [Deltaproteobacteria bacterium]